MNNHCRLFLSLCLMVSASTSALHAEAPKAQGLIPSWLVPGELISSETAKDLAIRAGAPAFTHTLAYALYKSAGVADKIGTGDDAKMLAGYIFLLNNFRAAGEAANFLTDYHFVESKALAHGLVTTALFVPASSITDFNMNTLQGTRNTFFLASAVNEFKNTANHFANETVVFPVAGNAQQSAWLVPLLGSIPVALLGVHAVREAVTDGVNSLIPYEISTPLAYSAGATLAYTYRASLMEFISQIIQNPDVAVAGILGIAGSIALMQHEPDTFRSSITENLIEGAALSATTVGTTYATSKINEYASDYPVAAQIGTKVGINLAALALTHFVSKHTNQMDSTSYKTVAHVPSLFVAADLVFDIIPRVWESAVNQMWDFGSKTLDGFRSEL